ncbi:MAG: T9SS type A sorting domain-containing protein [Saprospiraceae bacterium]|nr:T9SS type A sorting domain-containing protein [Saprospiraceae bacterium]
MCRFDYSITGKGELGQTWTSSEAYSTNDAEEAVGVRSDLYVGETYNIIFGVTDNLEFVPNEVCNTTALACLEIHPSLPYKIAPRTGFTISPSKDKTTFIYDQNYILFYLIPNLKRLRNNLFINQPAKYVSKLQSDNDNYGKNNDDPVWGMAVSDETDTAKKKILDSLKTQYGSLSKIPEVQLAKTYKNNPYETERRDSTGMSYTWIPSATDISASTNKPIYGIGTDSVRYYNQAIRLWEEAIRDNEKDKITAINAASQYRTRNISLNGGTSFSNEESYTSSGSVGLAIEFSVAQNFKTAFESKVAGSEATAEIEQSNTFNLEVEVNRSSATTTTWAYEIKDDDQGDFHNIEVYQSPAGWGPIFRNIAGQTSCPHEEGQKTLFHQPGAELSVRTLQRDKIGIDIFPQIVQNVPEGESAVFNIQLQNTSETNDAREYAIRVDPNSNPDGLGVSMDGETITVENTFALTGGSVLSKLITVDRGPEKYEYKDIRLLVYAPCQYQAGTADEIDIVDTVTFSVSFLPECTNIRLKEPTDLWVLNTFNKDTLPITIDNYDINKSGFESISLQYRPSSEATWRELNKWWHPTTKANEAGDKIPLNSSFIRYFWDMSSNVDGPYQLRVVSGCALANKETEFKKGTADRINPAPFGTPSPGDGICDPGEDLKIRFNEMVDIGSLTALNFDIRGVLNGTPLRNSESVAFDGNNDYMEIPAFDLTRRSFAVEFWAKLNAIGAGTVFSQGNSASEGLFVGFNASSQFQFSFAGQTLTSTDAIPTGEWKHFVASFDVASTTAKLFIDGVEKRVSNGFTTPYVSTGNIRVGQTIADGSKPFNGNVHELRLWSTSRSTIEIVPNFNISLSPTTAGLMGYWQMNEGVGTLAEDRVRKRNGVLNGATWAIAPIGRAFRFNGTSDYLELSNAGLISFTEETDMTIEMWFKGTSAGTLFSNGKGDGTDNTTSWTFGLNASGKIVVSNNGITFESNTSGYLDDNWHHLAVVLKRNSAINLYVDGQLQKTGSSNGWKGFAGSKLWIGGRGWFNGSVETRDQYFAGNLDDIRIWNLARRPEQIGRDWVNRLSGDELGLIAYYPFEAYRLDAGVPVLDASLADQSMNSYDLTRGGSTSLNFVQPTPPIKLQRPIEKVNFNYIVNDDEIILTPTDPSSRLEHSTLDITVRGVKDVHGNLMQSPATWIAFMNKNQINWDRSNIELVKAFGQTGAFEATIVNSGGSQEEFQILNLPSWLTATPTSGTIAPNSQLTIKFAIADAVNIGKYEQDLFLSTDFGFNERLTLDLKVKATPPTWAVNTTQFQHTMSYVGQLVIENIVSTDTEDQLAVFVNNQLRGVANVVLDAVSSKYLVFLDVYSNEVAGEELEFRIWDASEGKVRVPVNPTDQMFVLHEFTGTRTNPQIFSASNSVEQAYSLNSGWNWISFPLSSSVLMDVNETLDGLTPVENDRILSQQYFDTYTSAGGWVGSLSSTGNGFNRKELYKVYLTNPGTFTYNGTFDAPSNDPITIGAGWNWIGFISQKNMEINTALATLSPSNGDVIKGQRTFAVYESGLGWGGSLTYLEPTQGYMLRMANTGTLIYPTVSNLTEPNETLVKSSNRLKVLEAQMELTPADFQENMSIVGTIAECTPYRIQENSYLAAFVGNDCRGIAPLQRSGKSWRVYLTIHGNKDEQISFRLLEGDKSKTVQIKQEVTFDAAQLLGMPSEPYSFELNLACDYKVAAEAVPSKNIRDIAVYPNPFDDRIMVEMNLEQAEWVTVKLQDVNGRTISILHNGNLDAGAQQMAWKANDAAPLPAGIYFLSIQSDSMHHVKKIGEIELKK